MIEKKEIQHRKQIRQAREKEFKKKRLPQIDMNQSINPIIFKQIITSYSVRDIIEDIERLDTLRTLSYLTLIEDEFCEKYLIDEGILTALIKRIKLLLQNYDFQFKSADALQYSLNSIGNLWTSVQSEDLDFIISESMQLCSKLVNQALSEVLFWFISRYVPERQQSDDNFRQDCWNFLMEQIKLFPDNTLLGQCLTNIWTQELTVTIQDIEQIIKSSTDILKHCCPLIYRLVIKNKQYGEMMKSEDVLFQFRKVFVIIDDIDLLQVGIYTYQIISTYDIVVDIEILVSRFESCDKSEKLLMYDEIIRSYISRKLIDSSKYKSMRKVLRQNEYLSKEFRLKFKDIYYE